MKIKNLLLVLLLTSVTSSMLALEHGSLIVKNAPLYPQRDNRAPAETPIEGQTLSFKLVTIDNKSWAWTELAGTNIMGEAWSSQLRWWNGTNKTENNLLGRVAGTQQTYGSTTIVPSVNPLIVTIFQHITGEWVFRETDDFDYDYTLSNSADEADQTAPILADPVIEGQSATLLSLTLSATDDSGDYFYYITDDAQGYKEVMFSNSADITLEDGVDYNFTIQAIDFSGNASNTKTVEITGKKFVCYNLLDTHILTKYVDPNDGSNGVYFAPGWTKTDNYSFEISEGNVVSLGLNVGTWEMWQAQFPIIPDEPIVVTSGEKYSLIVEVETSKNLPFYAKFFDGNDNVFMEIPKQTVNTPGKQIMVNNIACPAGLTQISKILFDFGGNAEETDITLSNISICGVDPQTSISQVVNKTTAFKQIGGQLIIDSSQAVQSIDLYSVSGQLIRTNNMKQSIDISSLTTGIYIVKWTDESGKINTHKFNIK